MFEKRISDADVLTYITLCSGLGRAADCEPMEKAPLILYCDFAVWDFRFWF